MSTKTPMTAGQLRDMAERIRTFASRYDKLAADLEKSGINEFMVTGMTSFESHVVAGLGRHTRRLKGLLDAEKDAIQRFSVAESSKKYVVDDAKTKKKSIRRAKKPADEPPADNH
jgi:hypothetical protein